MFSPPSASLQSVCNYYLFAGFRHYLFFFCIKPLHLHFVSWVLCLLLIWQFIKHIFFLCKSLLVHQRSTIFFFTFFLFLSPWQQITWILFSFPSFIFSRLTISSFLVVPPIFVKQKTDDINSFLPLILCSLPTDGASSWNPSKCDAAVLSPSFLRCLKLCLFLPSRFPAVFSFFRFNLFLP